MTPTQRSVTRETREAVRVLWPQSDDGTLLPWTAGQQGQQTFLKLSRDDDHLLLHAGTAGVVDADVQRDLMRLTSEGWALQGEVCVSFDGTSDPDAQTRFGPETCLLEIGASLLPLVDPYQRAPLLEKLRDVRREVTASMGVIVPGIEVRDDMQLDPSAYRVRVRGVEVARGQVFLDRILAVGSLEQLASLTGWAAVEPTYRLPAKWIEPSEREKADAAGCTLLGSLAVILTHIRETLRENASTLLGLQETHTLLMRLRCSHPIVVEEFLSSIGRVRRLRHVLQALLAENVPIRDLVSILEIVGDRIDALDDVEGCAEAARRGLAREILSRAADGDGVVRALVLDDATEARLADEEAAPPGEADGFVRAVKAALEEHSAATVLFTPPDVRRRVSARLVDLRPRLSVVSAGDLGPGLHVEIEGCVKWARPQPPAGSQGQEDAPGFWKSRKKK